MRSLAPTDSPSSSFEKQDEIYADSNGRPSVGRCGGHSHTRGTKNRRTAAVEPECQYVEICQAVPIESVPSYTRQPLNTYSVTAEFVGSDSECSDVATEAKAIISSDTSMWNDRFGRQEISAYDRPMFIFCQVIKPSPDYPLGIYFETSKSGDVYISRIDWDSIFAKTMTLSVGDQVVAVNSTSTRHLTSEEVSDLLRAAHSSVSITARNLTGDSNFVVNSIQQLCVNDRIGLTVQNNKHRTGSLTVLSVKDWSAFRSSLLDIGHHVISINDIPCQHLRAQEAVELLHSMIASPAAGPNNDTFSVTLLTRIPSRAETNVATVISSEAPKKRYISLRKRHHFIPKAKVTNNSGDHRNMLQRNIFSGVFGQLLSV